MPETYTVGTTLVYPHHGAVTVTGITTRTIKGTPTEYMTLQVHGSDLVIHATTAGAADLGVRDVIDETGVEAVYDLLRIADVEEAANWSRRFKDNQAKMISGNVYKVAEVVRDVWRRDQDKGISAGEKAMLSRARHILVSELALALGKPVDDADNDLTEVLTIPAA